MPWKNGKLLVWDATCTDTFALSYIASATSNAGAVATLAEEMKLTLYGNLVLNHYFVPVAFEIFGVIGPQSTVFEGVGPLHQADNW